MAAADCLAEALQGQLRESGNALAAAEAELAAAKAEIAAVSGRRRHGDGHQISEGSPARQTGMGLALVRSPPSGYWQEVRAGVRARTGTRNRSCYTAHRRHQSLNPDKMPQLRRVLSFHKNADCESSSLVDPVLHLNSASACIEHSGRHNMACFVPQATATPMAAFSPDFRGGSNAGGANIPAWHGIPALRRLSPAPPQRTPANETAPPESAGSCVPGHGAAQTPTSPHGGQVVTASSSDTVESLRSTSPTAVEGSRLDLGRFASTPNPLFDAPLSDACQEEGCARHDTQHVGSAADVSREEPRVRRYTILHVFHPLHAHGILRSQS